MTGMAATPMTPCPRAISDPAPVRMETRRGEWRVLEADFHAHTRFSDGFLSPLDLVLQARRRGLDVLAVTEHNNVFPALIARSYARHVDHARRPDEAARRTIVIGLNMRPKF